MVRTTALHVVHAAVATRSVAALAAVAVTVLGSAPASAVPVEPGINAEPDAARPGDPVLFTLVGGVPDGERAKVTIALERGGERVVLATFWQRSFRRDAALHIPATTPPGTWTVRSSTGLTGRVPFRVLAPRTLPRTAGPATVPLAGVGAWLVVAGAYAVAGARRR